jgi:molybdenum cofactor cytidylyltransferase
VKPLRLAALLLAAGRGRRFGTDKLLARLPDGTPLAVAALRPLRAAVDTVFAVVRPDAAIAPLLAAEGARIVVAEDADGGIGGSIAAGVRALADCAADRDGPAPACDACLIALADMPFVRSETMLQIAQALRAGASLVAPEFRGTRGHPVGFSCTWFAQLSTLRGDQGARDLLAVHREDLQRVPVADPGVLADVDRPADLEAYTAAWS